MDSKKVIIVMIDIAKYTKNSAIQQVEIFKKLQKETYYFLFDELHFEDKAIVIPTGDGFIIGIIEQDAKTWLKAVEFIIYLEEKKDKLGFILRYALNTGDSKIIRDINRQKNMVGNLINDTSRIVNCADENGIVISESFFREYLIKDRWETGIQYEMEDCKLNYKIISEDIFFDKHNKEHKVYSIAFLRDNKQLSKSFQITSKYQSVVYGSEYPKSENLRENFILKIKDAKSIILLGIFHPSTPETIKNVVSSKEKPVVLKIYYASDGLSSDIKDYFVHQDWRIELETKKKSIDQINKWYKKEGKSDFLKIEIYEYNSIPIFGASLIDPLTSGKGFIHISSYFRGVLPQNTPYTEVSWNTREIPPLYNFYYEQIRGFIEDKENINKLEII
jgi:hypothetical protein